MSERGPGTEAENESGRGECIAALRLDDLWEGEMTAIRIGHREVLLIHVGPGEVRAYDNRCPHAGSRLSEGKLTSASLQCATHLWEFDPWTGAGMNPRACRLVSYPVRIDGGMVMVRLV